MNKTIDKKRGVKEDSDKLSKLTNELKKSEEKFNLLIQSVPVVIVQLDSDYKLIEFNKEAEKLYGEKREDVLGKNYFDLFLPEHVHEDVSKEIQGVLSGKKTRGFENVVLDKLKREHLMSWNSDRILDSNGEVLGIIAVGMDITERKNNEEELALKVEELKKMNKIMTGREVKMVELKREMEVLQKQVDDLV